MASGYGVYIGPNGLLVPYFSCDCSDDAILRRATIGEDRPDEDPEVLDRVWRNLDRADEICEGADSSDLWGEEEWNEHLRFISYGIPIYCDPSDTGRDNRDRDDTGGDQEGNEMVIQFGLEDISSDGTIYLRNESASDTADSEEVEEEN